MHHTLLEVSLLPIPIVLLTIPGPQEFLSEYHINRDYKIIPNLHIRVAKRKPWAKSIPQTCSLFKLLLAQCFVYTIF